MAHKAFDMSQEVARLPMSSDLPAEVAVVLGCPVPIADPVHPRHELHQVREGVAIVGDKRRLQQGTVVAEVIHIMNKQLLWLLGAGSRAIGHLLHTLQSRLGLP